MQSGPYRNAGRVVATHGSASADPASVEMVQQSRGKASTLPRLISLERVIDGI